MFGQREVHTRSQVIFQSYSHSWPRSIPCVTLMATPVQTQYAQTLGLHVPWREALRSLIFLMSILCRWQWLSATQ